MWVYQKINKLYVYINVYPVCSYTYDFSLIKKISDKFLTIFLTKFLTNPGFAAKQNLKLII